ncbi:hypothetical protein HUJ05_008504 [Dendroctonus ponderosae]|nr:hypothetical protein HUJ05_008504 [Dendroctonus ponderosae]
MEVVAAPPPPTGGVPFRDRDVREWSRIDSITGALERARLETDSWSASTKDASHRYGKCNNVASGRRQYFSIQSVLPRLEPVSKGTRTSCTVGGFAVLGSVARDSPSTRSQVVDSRARTGADGSLQAQASRQLEVFQSRAAGAHLQVVKTKTVSSSRWSGKGTESSIKGFENLQLPLNPLDLTSEKSKASVGRSANRRPPSRPQRNPANDLHSQLRSAHFTAATNLHRVSRLCHHIHESAVRNAFGRKSPSTSPRGSADGSVSGVEITEIESSVTNSSSDLNAHSNLARTKSNSSEDVHQVPEAESSVKSVEDLEDLEQLQSWRRNSKVRRSLQIPAAQKAPTAQLPENATVNVKKLRDELEKGRRLTTALRNNSISTDLNALDNIIQSISSASSLERSSTDDNLDEEWLAKHKQKRESFVTVESLQAVKGRLRHTSSPYTKLEDSDDGIVSEDLNDNQTTVKSYIYGMEKALHSNKSVIGTGSLESRSKLTNGTGSHKSEDWYNRRKSYGFEKVHGSEEASSMLKGKNLVESSTDSGICRSSEIMVVPTAINSGSETEPEACQANGASYGKVRKMTSIFNQEDRGAELGKAWRQTSWKSNEIKSTTITIPIVKNNNVVDLSWNDQPEKEGSRAVAEPLQLPEDENATNGRRGKKVEFCKTEVHFAAESGKVNIVETDEKPPPTQNFRRRRRNSGPTSDYPEDFNKNGLPVLHFGDTSYEKTMFGLPDEPEKTPSAFSVVTVNTSSDYHTEYTDEERKDLMADNDNLKGILKNKPVKPRPYHLGQLEDPEGWGVKLRHVPQEPNAPIWRSTVTVHSTVHEPTPDLPEFQKLLRNLRPTTKKTDYLSDNENRYSDSFAHVRMLPAAKDNRRSSWSVADRVPLVDDIQESRGYSTKVNFGDGQATVVQSDQSTWPRMENLSKDSKQILNRGLVVRIGREDSISKHTVCSKMTTTRQLNNNTTTTTKITIDLSPSPPTSDKTFTFTKFKRSHHLQHSFKSTPLVLNTLKDRKAEPNKIPQQLEALRKLYEDVASDDGDSDADKEVQRLLSRVSDKELTSLESDASSVVSGSWSRMRAFKNLAEAGRSSFKEAKSKFDLTNAKDIKDNTNPTRPMEPPAKAGPTYNKYSIPTNHSKYSPVVLRKSTLFATTEPKELIPSENRTEDCSINNSRSSEFRNVANHKVPDQMVLRQPKQSEMTYFGVGVSAARDAVKKPDLLQNHQKPRRPTPEQEKKPPPIYENLKGAGKPLKYPKPSSGKEFDVCNGYTSEDCQARLSSDEDEPKKLLDTISESKSWKNSSRDIETKNQLRMRPTLASAAKVKVKRTSSTSSLDSLSRDRRKPAIRPAAATKAAAEKPRRKPASDGASSKASTKARRLQRASSREALLQSHGSSSEDLPANVEAPVRKPRLIKKTKATQLTMTSGFELKKPLRKPKEENMEKSEARILRSLPEIRYKTAVSTITSTVEKCSRDRSKSRNEEAKSRGHSRRESSSKGKQLRNKSRQPYLARGRLWSQ